MAGETHLLIRQTATTPGVFEAELSKIVNQFNISFCKEGDADRLLFFRFFGFFRLRCLSGFGRFFVDDNASRPYHPVVQHITGAVYLLINDKQLDMDHKKNICIEKMCKIIQRRE